VVKFLPLYRTYSYWKGAGTHKSKGQGVTEKRELLLLLLLLLLLQRFLNRMIEEKKWQLMSSFCFCKNEGICPFLRENYLNVK